MLTPEQSIELEKEKAETLKQVAELLAPARGFILVVAVPGEDRPHGMCSGGGLLNNATIKGFKTQALAMAECVSEFRKEAVVAQTQTQETIQ